MDFVSIMKQTAIRIAYTSCKFVPRGWLVRGVKLRRAAVQPRSRGHGCGMLSPGPERGAALPKPLRDPVCRPQPSAQSPKEEAAKGAEGRRRRKKGAQIHASHNALCQEAIQRGLCFSTGNFLR